MGLSAKLSEPLSSHCRGGTLSPLASPAPLGWTWEALASAHSALTSCAYWGEGNGACQCPPSPPPSTGTAEHGAWNSPACLPRAHSICQGRGQLCGPPSHAQPSP